MGLTSAMLTGLTGLAANGTRVETIGNNIANVNTTAFKGSRTLFQTLFSQTLSPGTAPSATTGGTNPMQVGHGVAVGATTRTTTGGALETTGLPADLALDGNGFFIVQSAAGRDYYTRDGAFSLNEQNQLITANGQYLMGYGVDSNFSVVPGTLSRLTIPLGQDLIARATQNVSLDGVLSAAETIAASGSTHTSQSLVNGSGAAVTDATALTDVHSAGATGTALFATGDVITINGITKGDRSVTDQQFVVGTTGTTLGDFAAWLEEACGIQTADGVSGSPGVTIENGALVIRSNTGDPNSISINGDDLVSSNAAVGLPFEFTNTARATGGGVYTSFTVYDSLGNPVSVNATFTLEETPNTGPVWRYYLESPDVGSGPTALGTGTVTFDTDGNYVRSSGNQFTLDRSGTGAANALTFSLDLENLNGLATSTSEVILDTQDGYPPGTLNAYSIGNDGVISGTYSNGQVRSLGQIPVATFINDQGLVAESENLFSVAPNSGAARIVDAGSLNAGTIRSGMLEMSNVDLTQEFIGLISASTGFQANSRVITVSNEMLDSLLLVLR